VRVLVGDGAGSFKTVPGPPAKVGGPIAVADFNEDGRPDLVAAIAEAREIVVLLGDGDGTFTQAPGQPIAAIRTPADVVAADLNVDSHADVSVAAQGQGVAILLGDGTGRLASAAGSPVRTGGRFDPHAVAVADFNRDGKPDLVVGNDQPSTISILTGNGAGGFGSERVVARGATRTLAVADLNADANPDLVAPIPGQRRVLLLLGDGAGRFTAAPGAPIRLETEPYRRRTVAVAELNGDGRRDLVAVNGSNSVSVLLGAGDGRFRAAPFSPVALPSPWAVAPVDLNRDGRTDVVAQWACFPMACPYEPPLVGGTILLQTAPAPAVAPARVLRSRTYTAFATRRRIERLAADGDRVAVVTARTKAGCGSVVVWSPLRRRTTTLKLGYLGCHGDGVGALALAATQVAWIELGGGNTLELHVLEAGVSGGIAKQVDETANGDRAGGDPSGGWVGHLLGGGSVLAYNDWEAVCDVPSGNGCTEGDAALRFTGKTLVRIVGRRRVTLRRGPGSYRLEAVGGGRLAVVAGGAVTVLSASGALVATVPAADGDPARAFALAKTTLAVQRTFSLDLYEPATGTRGKSLALGPAAALELAGVNAKLALVRGLRRLVLVRLADGKLISLPLVTGAAAGLVDARLTDAGLFYAYNSTSGPKRGRIVFEPTATLLRRF
jgi:FG-GAP-like repeat